MALLLLLLLLCQAGHARNASVELNTAYPFARVDEGFVGYTLSFITEAEDPTWANASIVSAMDLQSARLKTLSSGLGSAIVRVGGGAEHQVVYEVHGGECTTWNATAGFCLTMERWEATKSG